MEKVTESNDLGVVFDRKFTFKSHIDYIVSKANINLAFVKHYAREFKDHYIYKILFTSFVRSKLESHKPHRTNSTLLYKVYIL